MKRLLGVAVVLLLGCNTTGSFGTEILPELLINDWVHSFEEDAGDNISIYRPADYKEFPISMYRQEYKLLDDGNCEFLVMSGDDAHYFRAGVWQYFEDSKQLYIGEIIGMPFEAYTIVELTAAIMRVERILWLD